MKPRIKIDSSIVVLAVIFTGVLYQFPKLYVTNTAGDVVCEIVGLIFLLKGAFLRMVSRGFKKSFSREGQGLVTSGPYSIVRNPMYLGTFLIGFGYVLMFWPVWSVPIFMALFYLRFIRQIVLEEKHLNNLFGESYQEYCAKVPRMFPRRNNLKEWKIKEIFPWDLAWVTKEKRLLLILPLVALALEILKQKFIFGKVDFIHVLLVFFVAGFVFGADLLWKYIKNKK